MEVVATQGQGGDSLFHAAMLGLVGMHDRYDAGDSGIVAVLRKANRRMFKPEKFEIQLKARFLSGLSRDADWQKVINEAEKDELTEPIHTFALAQTLRRPIIVYADEPGSIDGHSHAGIYLPLLRDSESCCKNPLLLVHNTTQFSACLTKQPRKNHHLNSSDENVSAPLMQPSLRQLTNVAQLKPLPVRFVADGENAQKHCRVHDCQHGAQHGSDKAT